MEVLIPFLMSEIIDNGIEASNLGYTIKMGLLLVVFALLALLFGALSGHFAASASSGYAKNLRKEIFYKIQGYSFANIDKFSTSSLVTRLTTDVTNVQQAFQMIIRHRSALSCNVGDCADNGICEESKAFFDFCGNDPLFGNWTLCYYETRTSHI